MDDDLQKLLCMQSLQRYVLTYRKNPQFKKIMKAVCIAELRNMVNVEIDMEEVALKIPDAKQLPPIESTIDCKPQEKLDSLLKEYKNTKDAFYLLMPTKK